MHCDGWERGITLITLIQNCWPAFSLMFCFLCLLTQSRSLYCALFAWSQGIPRWLTYCGITLGSREAQRVQPLAWCPHWSLCSTQSWTSVSDSATSAVVAWDPVWHQITFWISLIHHASPAWHSHALPWDWKVLTCPFYAALDAHSDALPPKHLPQLWLDLVLFCTLVGRAACLSFQNLWFVLLAFLYSSLYCGLLLEPQELRLMAWGSPAVWLCLCLVGQDVSLELSLTNPSPIAYDISTLPWVFHIVWKNFGV